MIMRERVPSRVSFAAGVALLLACVLVLPRWTRGQVPVAGDSTATLAEGIGDFDSAVPSPEETPAAGGTLADRATDTKWQIGMALETAADPAISTSPPAGDTAWRPTGGVQAAGPAVLPNQPASRDATIRRVASSMPVPS